MDIVLVSGNSRSVENAGAVTDLKNLATDLVQAFTMNAFSLTNSINGMPDYGNDLVGAPT
jgi:hypothetical protein